MANSGDKMLTFLADVESERSGKTGSKALSITKLGIKGISEGRAEIESE